VHMSRDNLTSGALIIATLALSLFYSHGRIMWSDELFGWMLVTDPSIDHMLHAWNAGADGGGVLFYMLARLWLALFGQTATAFRLFSATGVALGAVFTFRASRLFFRWEIAAFCVSLLWFSSDVVLWQIMQARFYGLLLAGVAAAAYLFVLTSDTLTTKRLVLTFLCHTLLAGTHPFGVLYSGVIIFVMVSSDVLAHRLRTRLYLAALSGWWILLLSIKAMRNTAAVGKPHFWTTKPELVDLGNAYSCWSLATAVVLGTLATFFIARLCFARVQQKRMWETVTVDRSILFLSAGLLSVPLFVFLISQHGNSLFVDRYLVPVVIGMCFLLCQLLSSLIPASDSADRASSLVASKLFRYAWLALAPVLALIALVQFPSYWRYPAPDSNLGLIPLLPKDLPIVVEAVDVFDQLLAYHREPGYQFTYLLDWENVTAPGSPRGEVSGYHEMENWRSVGYFSGSIQYSDTFLAQTPAFVVIDDPGLFWFDRKIRLNPGFEVQALGEINRGPKSAGTLKLWLVRRRFALARESVDDSDRP